MSEKNEKKETIFVGSAKVVETSIGEVMKLKISPEQSRKIAEWAKEHDGWVNIDILKNKQPTAKGYTHNARIDQWKPDNTPNTHNQSDAPSSDMMVDEENLPF